jgi:hypothetical protein
MTPTHPNYQHFIDIILRETEGQSSTPKEAIPDEPYDPRIEIFGDVKGRTEQVKLLDLDLMDQVLFP